MSETFRGARGTRRLASSAAALAHQRSWFAELHEQVAAGEPLVLADADVPHELLRAMGIPYVVNQWWASICSAKQRAPHYLAKLRERGYPDWIEQYSAISLGSTLEDDPGEAPWGGLPPVSAFVTQAWTDAHLGIAEAWRRERDVPYFALEKAVDPRLTDRWWEGIAHDWETVVGTARLDLMSAELERLVEFLEQLTGKRLDEARLGRILELANEQQEWSRRTRDLLAATAPAPVDIVDSIPAVMLPQWHRGTEWARDAARAFHEEVESLVAEGAAVCDDERIRLMWIGRGLWFNLGFYQRLAERHGAVFVWSMYLAIAADGYARYGGPPLRQLAARFAAFTDFLGMPGWADPWYLKEAQAHGVGAVVHLVTAESRSPYFVTRALEDAGIPVLEIDADNADARGWDEQAFTTALEQFVEGIPPMRLLLLGDLILDEPDPDSFFEPSVELLRSADLVVGQVEVPHTSRGVPSSVDIPAPPADPARLEALGRAGLGIATLAGNHIFDSGPNGIEDTIATLHGLGIETAGAGMTLEGARRPAVANGVGVLSYNCVGPRESRATSRKAGAAALDVLTHYELDYAGPGGPPRVYTFVAPESLDLLRADVLALRETAAVVVVAFHKGIGHVPVVVHHYERELGRTAIDCGADVVVGHHAHILRGIEIYRGRPVFHGLGNFVAVTHALTPSGGSAAELAAWSTRRRELFGFEPDPAMPFYPFHPESRNTMIADCRIEGGAVDAGFVPCWIDDRGRPVPLERRDEVTGYIERITAEAGFDTRFAPDGERVRVQAGTQASGSASGP